MENYFVTDNGIEVLKNADYKKRLKDADAELSIYLENFESEDGFISQDEMYGLKCLAAKSHNVDEYDL